MKVIIDFFEMTREIFFKFYINNGRLTKEYYDNTLDKLWEELSDIPVNNTGEIIEDDFYIWKKGTSKEDIWHWFDERVQDGIGNRYFS
jgi:hypothetical protein